MSAPRTDKPELVVWELTRSCNLTCPHCYTAATRRPHNEMTTADCRRVLDELIELGTTFIAWTGGEPLLRDDLEELIVYAREKGKIESGVTTNGVLLDEARAQKLKDAGISSIQISLDGSTAERNRIMRRATDEEFAKVIEAIRVCRKLELKLHMAMVIGKETLDDVPAYIDLARREGVTSIRYCGFIPWGRGKRPDVIGRLLWNDHRDKLRKFVETAVQAENPVQMFDPAFGPTPPAYRFHTCTAGVKVLYLNCYGDVYPCTSLLDKQFVVGTVRRQSMREIWNDPKMTQIANYPREQITGHCRDCDYFPRCHGGCRGVTFAHTGDLNASFPACLRF